MFVNLSSVHSVGTHVQHLVLDDYGSDVNADTVGCCAVQQLILTCVRKVRFPVAVSLRNLQLLGQRRYELLATVTFLSHVNYSASTRLIEIKFSYGSFYWIVQ